MYKYHCLNPISNVGLGELDENYVVTENSDEADAIFVRSAKMHEMEFSENLKVIARAGAGVNNIPLDRCAEDGIVVFNTPGANANGVKELVIAGMLLAARDIIGGINWVQEYEEDGDIAKITEKKKKAFAGTEIQGKKLGVIGLGAIGAEKGDTLRYYNTAGRLKVCVPNTVPGPQPVEFYVESPHLARARITRSDGVELPCQVSPHPRGRRITFLDDFAGKQEETYSFAPLPPLPDNLTPVWSRWMS